jgi:DNA-directed RNA polymerase specialized sigma24 family protein
MRETGSQTFEDQWPDLARRLDAMLAGKRVPPHKRDDIVQETGLRLFRMWDQVDPERPLWALVVTIALNLLRDEARKRPEREVLGLVPDRPADQDVERAGLARLEWRRVQKAMDQLSPAHRSILLAELGDDVPLASRGANATKMLRMRARRRLSSLLDVASASGVMVAFRMRRLFDIERHLIAARSLLSSSENLAAPAAAGLISAVALFAATGGAFLGDAGSGSAPKGVPGADRSASQSFALTSAAAAGGGHFGADGNELGPGPSRGTRPEARDVEFTTSAGDGAETKNRPFRAETGDHFVEGGAEVGVLGMGVRVGDRDGQTPACLAPGSELMLPPGYICREGEGARDGVHVHVKAGSDEHSAEVAVDVE